MIDVTGYSLYQSWSKLTCPLSEGVLSGLYHFPIISGHVLFTLEAPFQALIQFSNVVGVTGQVCAIINPSIISPSELEFLKRWYPNIWFSDTGGKPFDPIRDVEETLHRKLILLHGSEDENSSLFQIGKHQSVLSSIFAYMGTFPSTPVTTIVNRFPLTIPLTNSSLTREYSDYFKSNLHPLISFISSRQSSFWMMGCYELDQSYTATDQCSETLLNLQATACGTRATVKPKEQLMIGSKMVLISRFKKLSITIPPCLTDDSDTIRSTLASICGGHDFCLDTSSVLSLQNPPDFVEKQQSFDNTPSVRDAAINLILSHSNKTIGGPFAETLRTLAEELLQTNGAPLLSTLLETPPGRAASDWSTTPPQLPRFLLEDVLG
jgi:hypothetical protein